MAVVLPFRGIRYDLNRAGAIDTLIAPPYDVVTKKERDRLVAQNPCNILALELPDYNGDKYVRAAALFNAWLKEGVLEKEDASAIYPYEIEFSLKGRTFSRRGMVALVRIEDWESRIIRPHEKTFDRVIEDRYRLLETTKAQFSQIFAIYRRREAVLSALAFGKDGSEPLFDVKDQAGNNHRLWRLTDKDAIMDIHDALFDQPLYIADGHHRYATALKYKMDMDAILGVDPSRPSNYLMAYLVDAEDPGLIVLPTHRIVTLNAEGFSRLNELSSAFEIEKIGNDCGLCAGFEAALSKKPVIPGFGVVLNNGGRRAEIWWLKDGVGYLTSIGMLDAAVLEDIVLKVLPCKAIAYSSDGEEAIKKLEQDQVLFFLRPTPVAKVLDIADQGFTMPHKSTFFYPKILTGLVLNSVDKVCPVEML
ncbi:MAG: DUF1015 domain-containing protein [Dissulfurimicrobium sp.]|uniref:DUF1015 domain-containing protein n=1 Tax=Dissulfurimicrobium sp. TaxID=2022436 RepID=UPI0040499C06